jgi:hypothetical protein
MGSSRKILSVVAMGASLTAFAALGSATPEEKAPKEDGGRSCCSTSKAGAGCCSDASGRSARSVILTSLRTQDGDKPAASKQQAKAGAAAMAKGVATRKALLDQVGALMEDGAADCCIDPGCGFCPIAADGCGCAASLAKGGPVCPECWGGWHAEQGMLPGVKAEDVKLLPKDVLKKLYDMKAKKLEAADKK